MANETHYGIISDVHQDPRVVPIAIDVLKKQGAEKLLINGDIGNQQDTLKNSQNYIAFILDSVGKSGLEAYIQPGSHETLLAFGPVMDAFSDKYSNLIDATKIPKAENKNHSLIFLPGSDFLCGGEYQIGNHEKIPTGKYIQTQKGLMQFEEFGQYVGAIQQGIAQGAMQYANMNDLRKLVNDPDKSIVVCHVPRKFDNLEYAVDMAEFGEAKETFNLNGNNVEQGSVFPLQIAQQILQAGYPVEIRRENRGNKDLKSIYEEIGINKAVSGHFHESGHRANDTYGNHVPEGNLVYELFWNSGYLDAGQTGILTVGDGKVSYRNIRLEEHLQ
jgi:Icc-related predicted phosphoesterase